MIHLLTTKPLQRSFSMDHPEWIYVVSTEDYASAQLRTIIWDRDGGQIAATVLLELGTLRAFEVRMLNISNAVYNYETHDPDEPIKDIDIFIRSGSTDSAVIKLVPSTPTSESIRALYYHNSLGGLDSMICTGEQQQSNEFSFVNTEKPVELGFGLDDAPPMQSINQEVQTSFNVNTGYKPKAEIKAFTDFFLIRRGYEYRQLNGSYQLIPIQPIMSALDHPSERASLHALSFGYKYAFTNKAMDQVL